MFLNPPGAVGGQGLTVQVPLLHSGGGNPADIVEAGSDRGVWEGEYVVPPGQTRTRLALADSLYADFDPSLSGYEPWGGIGNFVDSVSIDPYATACADTASTAYGEPVVVDVTANDLGTGLRATPHHDAAHGTVTVDPQTGRPRHQPAPGFSGTDSFTYELAGDYGRTDRTTVTVTVGAAPAAPTATATQCASRRTVTLHWRVPRGTRVKSTVITLNGKRIARLGARARAFAVKLAGLPRGAVRVRISARAAGARRLSAQRTYRLCTGKRKGPKLATLRLKPQRS